MGRILLVFALTALAAVTVAQLCPRADTDQKARFVADAKSVLDGNWVSSMNSTLPSPALYPHQWSWDSAFIAIGYSHYDTQRAIDEMMALFRGQWRNGNIPHIVFNPSAIESYFPGPDFWKIYMAGENGPAEASTSGITQPPVHALACLAIYENARGTEMKKLAMEHLREAYPKLSAWHDYLYNDRDPLKHGLVFIRHMWESGMDNSPAWDAILQRMVLKEGDVPAYQRVDKGKVAHTNERPDEYFYDRAVHLIKVFYDNAYDERRIFDASPFLVEDVLFNSILARAGEALARIADILGKKDEARLHRSKSEWTATAITERLYNEDDGYFYDFDLVLGKQIPARISGGLVGAYGAKMGPKQVDALVKALYSPGILRKDLSAWTIPSVSRDHPGYSNTTYWKGPAWINVNYLVREGLLRNANGNRDAMRIARYLKDRSLELMSKSGFYEYFNTISGSAHGGHQFSWSASIAIDWICLGDDMDRRPVVSKDTVSKVVALLLAAALIVVFLASPAAPKSVNAPVSALEEDEEEEDSEGDSLLKKQPEESMVPRPGLRLRTGRADAVRRV